MCSPKSKRKALEALFKDEAEVTNDCLVPRALSTTPPVTELSISHGDRRQLVIPRCEEGLETAEGF